MGSVINGLSRIPYGRAFALTSLPSTIPTSCLMLLGMVVTPFLPILMTLSNFFANGRTWFDDFKSCLTARGYPDYQWELGIGSNLG